jgi:carboxypeptidase-like protein
VFTRITIATGIASVLGAAMAHAQGSIAGRVMAAETKTPVVGAVVTVHGQTPQATTDSSGKFSLRDVKAGTVFLITSAVGFRPDTARVDVFPDESISRDVALQRSGTTLGEVVVREEPVSLLSAKLREFEERRRTAVGGRFLDSTVIRKWESGRTGDLLSTIPGLVTRQSSSAFVMAGRAIARPFAQPARCFLDIYLDGNPLAIANTPFDVNSISLTRVVAIEVYTGTATRPAPYDKTVSGCGVLLIWTK